MAVDERSPAGSRPDIQPTAGMQVGDRTSVGPAGIPSTIGHYRVLRLLAHGGMGAVYEAEQEHPRRKVALKLIRSGFATPDLRRRFEQEAQVLGRLQHPGIAQIYEAGSIETEYGPQPYFAMELIAGLPLLDYAAQNKLDVHARLELMAHICDAVQHAHQRGIIHRDLKPANILVDAQGQSKVLDFGVARIVDKDPQSTRHTETGQLVGTYAYMSPEQITVDSFDLDTRTDVYSLGVILYELLAGRPPVDANLAAPLMLRAILEEDAARLSSVSRVYRGDIETIVAKALDKDRAHRYVSCSDLAADIRHFLHDEPIVARPPSTLYQLQKFARRNRALVYGVVAVFIVLIAGITASLTESFRARRAEQAAQQQRDRALGAEASARTERDRAVGAEQTARSERDRAVRAEGVANQQRDRAVSESRRADAEAETAKAINDFLQNNLLAQASAFGQTGKPDPDMKVRTALDRAAADVQKSFAGRPKVEAAIERTIGLTYKRLSLYPEAQQHLGRSLELSRATFGREAPESLAAAETLGETLRSAGKYPEAEALLRDTVAAYERRHAPPNEDSLEAAVNLGTVYMAEGKYPAAEPILTVAVADAQRYLKPDHRITVDAMNVLARVDFVRGRLPEAEKLLRELIATQTRVLGGEHPTTIGLKNNLAVLLQRAFRFDEAEKLYGEVVDGERRALGPDHTETLNAMNNLGVLYSAEGKYAQAEPLFSQVLAKWRTSLGPEHPRTLSLLSNIGVQNQGQGKLDEAEKLFQSVLEVRRRVLGKEHSDTLDSTRILGSLYESQGKFTEAEPLLSTALEARRRVLGPKHVDTLTSIADLGELRLDQARYTEAETLLREALTEQQQSMPSDFRRFRTQSLLGAALAGEKRYAEAEPLLVAGFEGMKERRNKVNALYLPKIKKAADQLVHLYEDWGKPELAAARRKELETLGQ